MRIAFSKAVILLIFFLPAGAIAQVREIDSLRRVAETTTDPSAKFDIMVSVLLQGQSMHADSFYRYAQLTKQVASRNGNKHETALADYFIAQALNMKGLLDSSMKMTLAHLKQLDPDKADRTTYDRFINLEAQILIKQKKFKNASALYFNSLAKHEKLADTLYQLIDLTGIGWVNMEMDQPADAIPWFLKALKLSGNSQYRNRMAPLYSNLASCYDGLKKNDSAMIFIDTSIALVTRNHDLTALANSLNIKANIFLDMQQPAEAEKLLTEAVAVRKQTGDPFFIVSDMSELSLFYLHTGKPLKGIAIALEGIGIADSFHISTKMLILYQALADNYDAAGMHAQASETLRKIIDLKNRMYEQNSAEAMAALEEQYNVQKNENDANRKQLILIRRNSQLYFIAAAAGFIILASLFWFFAYRKRQRIIMQAALETKKKEQAIAVLKAEEKERKRISADLHDNLGAYATAIYAHIDHLQHALPATEHEAARALKENASSLVALLNDTIWALKKESAALTAISDRIKVFIRRIAPSYPSVLINVREDFQEDVQLNPSRAYDLFRIMQEAINNAYRHSGASEILVHIKISTDWEISITDNGIGPAAVQDAGDSGNGINNMNTRAASAGWKIFWKENNPCGTKLLLFPAEQIIGS